MKKVCLEIRKEIDKLIKRMAAVNQAIDPHYEATCIDTQYQEIMAVSGCLKNTLLHNAAMGLAEQMKAFRDEYASESYSQNWAYITIARKGDF